MKHNDIVLINKAKDLIRLHTGWSDDLRGMELLNDKLYIAFGETGMGSTFRVASIEWNDFINSFIEYLCKNNKIKELKFEINSKNYFGQYIDIGATKVTKNYQYDSSRDFVCDAFEDLKFIEDLEIKFI